MDTIHNLSAILIGLSNVDKVWNGTLDLVDLMGPVAKTVEGEEPKCIKAVKRFESVLGKHDLPP